ncbi:MAG: Kelch repeat-containing protein [Hyphomonadaceae bacterium]
MLSRRALLAAAIAAPTLQQACAAPGGGEPEASAWRTAPDAPYAVQEIYPAHYRGGVWIAGGFSPQAQGATERVIVLDLASQQWREGPALPTPSHHVQLAARNDELYAIGGFVGGDDRLRWNCTPRVLRLDGERWVDGPALPKPIAEASPIVCEGRIHLIGGRSPSGAANAEWTDQTDVDDHFVLAPGAAAWERAAPLPLARNSSGCAVNGSVIHVISGRTVASGQTPAHHIYDARAGAWRTGPAYPDPRGGLAAAFFRGRVVACGGEIFEPGSVGDALYELTSDGWMRFQTMPTPRHGHGLVEAGSALYAIGGARRPGGNGALSSVDVLD